MTIAVYLDLDGVMADYDAGIRALGFDIDPAYKNDLNRSGTKNPLKRQMYEAIKGTDYYRRLPLMPGALRLYREVAQFDPIILTAAPKFSRTEEDYFLDPHWAGAAYHKRHWVEFTLLPHAAIEEGHPPGGASWFIPIPDERFICTTSARKWQFMHRKHAPHQVLIDDRIDNCRAWQDHGGHAILHTSAEESIAAFQGFRRQHGL